jgi:hypothetical protein
MKKIIAALCLLTAIPFAPASASQFDVTATTNVLFMVGPPSCSSTHMSCLPCWGWWTFGNQGDLTGNLRSFNLTRGRTYTFQLVWHENPGNSRVCVLPQPFYIMDGKKYDNLGYSNRLGVPNR